MHYEEVKFSIIKKWFVDNLQNFKENLLLLLKVQYIRPYFQKARF